MGLSMLATSDVELGFGGEAAGSEATEASKRSGERSEPRSR